VKFMSIPLQVGCEACGPQQLYRSGGVEIPHSAGCPSRRTALRFLWNNALLMPVLHTTTACMLPGPWKPSDPPPCRARYNMTLHGTTRSLDTEANVEKTADEVSVTGTFRIHAHRVEHPARQPGEFM
jgi:hypothetical protein